ncbi:MAG: sigma 54 modulation/S30EA ribosomal C-terminal domain-containing protein [Caldilineaceae bacterium]|nr:sigma 54 modulation/S30EA ribosomal C-terminal domain-containing protein [Caldilineaceae bacterium]
MSRQIERYKGRRFKNKRREAAAGAADADLAATILPEEAEVEAEELLGNVVRTKRFLVQPMTQEEAADQMELLGHDFFIYFSVEANALNVLYRRKDGNYGLLQPEQG